MRNTSVLWFNSTYLLTTTKLKYTYGFNFLKQAVSFNFQETKFKHFNWSSLHYTDLFLVLDLNYAIYKLCFMIKDKLTDNCKSSYIINKLVSVLNNLEMFLIRMHYLSAKHSPAKYLHHKNRKPGLLPPPMTILQPILKWVCFAWCFFFIYGTKLHFTGLCDATIYRNSLYVQKQVP